MSTVIDLSPLVGVVATFLAAILTALAAYWTPKIMAAIEARTHVQFTEAQRQAVQSAVMTGAGVLTTQLDQGLIKVSHITVNSPVVAKQVQAVINQVPEAVDHMGYKAEDIANMIVGATDTKAAPPAPTINVTGGANTTVDTSVVIPSTHEAVSEIVGNVSRMVIGPVSATTPATHG